MTKTYRGVEWSYDDYPAVAQIKNFVILDRAQAKVKFVDSEKGIRRLIDYIIDAHAESVRSPE